MEIVTPNFVEIIMVSINFWGEEILLWAPQGISHEVFIPAKYTLYPLSFYGNEACNT